MFKKFLSIVFVLALILVVLSGWAVAQEEFPTKPIDIIVGMAPGGTTDLAARFLAATAPPFLNDVAVNVVNMPGGHQMVALDYVASSVDPDGYTLMVGYGEHNTKVLMGLDLPVKVDPDPEVGAFRPIIGSFGYSSALLVPYDSPFESIDELVEYAKENPGELNWGHTGAYGLHWMMGMSFLEAADVDLVEVPFEGGPATRQAVTGGHIDCAVAATFLVPDFITDKLIRALAIFAPERDPLVEDVPTFRELGYDVFDALSFKIIGAPAETPDWKIERLYEGFKQAEETTAFKHMIESQGFIFIGWSPEECQEKAQEYDSKVKELIVKDVLPKIE